MSQFILPSRATDANANPLSGALLYFYREGTLEPMTTYSDAALTNPHPNPVFANSSGLFPSIYTNTAYVLRVILKTADGVTISDYDPYIQIPDDLTGTTGAGMVGTSDASTVQAALNKLGNENLGTLASGGTISVSMDKTFIGHPDGTTDYRGLLISTKFSGANNGTQSNGIHLQAEARHTAGTLTYLRGGEGYARLGLLGSATGSVTAARVWEGHIANESLAGVIASAIVYYANGVDLASGAGSITSMIGFAAGDQGHATRVTAMAVGFNAANMTAGAPVTAGFRTDMAFGTGKWGFLSAGGANNAFFGQTRFGDNVVPTEAVDVTGNVKVSGVYKVGANQVLGARSTGWAAATGTATRSTFATGAVTLPQLAEHVKALIDDLIAHGAIGA